MRQLIALCFLGMSYVSACVVLLSVARAQAQEMDMTPQLLFEAPSTAAPDATSPAADPAAPTAPAAAGVEAPATPGSAPLSTAAASPWQKSTAFQLRPPLEGVNYGWQTALAYLMPIPMVPIVHGIHGNWGRGFLGVLGFYASAIGGACAGHVMIPEDGSSVFVSRGMGLGLIVGAIAWVVFDATTLAVEDSPSPVTGRLPTFVYERH